MNGIISAAEQLTCPQLTDILRQRGVLRDARVVDIQHEPIGIGLLGESVRFKLTYDRDDERAPRNLAGKFPSKDATARTSGATLGIYMTEVRFYQEIAPTVAIRSPRCFYAEIDPTTFDFGILMEDMGPARQGDQIAGCSLEDAFRAMEQAAALHGPRWNDPELKNLEWTKTREPIIKQVMAALPQMLATYEERYADIIEPEYMDICKRYVDKAVKFSVAEMPQWTMVHGDYRLDNMLFDAQGGQVPLAVLDWQTAFAGSGAQDVGFFLGSCLSIEQRRAHQDDLLAAYLDGLKRYGVTGYSAEEFQRDYRVMAFQGISTAIIASSVAQSNERSLELFKVMGRNACAQMMDFDTLGAIE